MTHTLFDTTQADSDRPTYYRGYSVDTSDDEARAAFIARFGVAPARILRQRSVVLVGPVPTTAEGGAP